MPYVYPAPMLRRVGSLIAGLALVVAACSGSAATPTTGTTAVPTTTTAPVPTTSATTAAQGATTTAAGGGAIPADLFISGGPIVTMDPDVGTAEAVAVRGGTIIAVGPAAEVATYVGPFTTNIDLGGRALLPGFIDTHTHLLSDAGEPILDAQKTALANGITSIADASVEPELLDRYLAVADELRIWVGLYLNRVEFCGEDQGTWYEAYPPGTALADRLFVAGVKIFADGGACRLLASSEPFIEGVEVEDPYFTAEALTEMVGTAAAAGYQVLIHAQGDRAIRNAQDAIAAVLDGTQNKLRHRIDHNSIMTPDLLPRYSEIGIVPVIFGYFPTCADVAWTDFFKENGETWRALLDANPGLPIAWHGDDPSLPPVLPLLDLASYVTRADVAADGSLCQPPPWLARSAITVEEGLAMMTRNAAYAVGREAEVGTITPGKDADLVVVSADPTAVAPEELFGLEVLATYLSGAVAYCRPGNLELCPTLADETGMTASASASRPGREPEAALDGVTTGDSFWSSGADPPQWLQVDFAEPTAVERLRFVVFQNPESDTIHELEIMVNGEWRLAERFEGFTATGDVLEWEAGDADTPISAFRMTTLVSLSWPEWYEVEIDVAE